MDEMEAMGYDLTDYKGSLSRKIGGATKEEGKRRKKEAFFA